MSDIMQKNDDDEKSEHDYDNGDVDVETLLKNINEQIDKIERLLKRLVTRIQTDEHMEVLEESKALATIAFLQSSLVNRILFPKVAFRILLLL